MTKARAHQPQWWLLAIFIFGVLWSPTTLAHKLAPSSLELKELREGYYSVSWQRPQWVPRDDADPQIILPDHCQHKTSTETHAAPTPTGIAVFAVTEVDCGERNLFGSSVSVSPLSATSMVMARIIFLNERSLSTLLTHDKNEWRIQAYPGLWPLLKSYMSLGVGHILTGYDHLLFVLGLLLLVQGVRALIWLISAFTLGHSVSLSLVAFNAISIPQDVADFFVALSIFWLAVELGREQANRSILGKHPVGMASAFGLLHGLGFAGALLEIGLPVRDTLPSLLSFNIGIELGQLMVVAVAIALAMVLPSVLTQRLRFLGVYMMGTVSVYWCIDRSVGALI